MSMSLPTASEREFRSQVDQITLKIAAMRMTADQPEFQEQNVRSGRRALLRGLTEMEKYLEMLSEADRAAAEHAFFCEVWPVVKACFVAVGEFAIERTYGT
jgi:hypothetical protein